MILPCYLVHWMVNIDVFVLENTFEWRNSAINIDVVKKKSLQKKNRPNEDSQNRQQGLWTICRKRKLKHNLSSFSAISMLNSCISLVTYVQKLYMQQLKNTKIKKQTKTLIIQFCKKSLKIPKGQSETVYRRTYNTKAKRKRTKGQTTIDKTYI